MEEIKIDADIQTIATKAMGDLIYTVIFDVANEVISNGLPEDKVLESATAIMKKYVEGGVKIRKKPAPRAKTEKAPPKEKKVDALTAAHKKINSLSDNLVWVVHPDDKAYSFTTSVKLSTGYPVIENSTQKVVMVATETSSEQLTKDDVDIARSLGLAVDFDKVHF